MWVVLSTLDQTMISFTKSDTGLNSAREHIFFKSFEWASQKKITIYWFFYSHISIHKIMFGVIVNNCVNISCAVWKLIYIYLYGVSTFVFLSKFYLYFCLTLLHIMANDYKSNKIACSKKLFCLFIPLARCPIEREWKI